VVFGVGHDELVVGRQRHTVRPVEACGNALPICEALLPVAGQRADLAGLGHAAQGVVFGVSNNNVAGRVHRHAARAVEARVGALAVLKSLIFVLVPQPRWRQQLQLVLAGGDQAVAVGHHKHAVGLIQPGHLEGGHGGVEGALSAFRAFVLVSFFWARSRTGCLICTRGLGPRASPRDMAAACHVTHVPRCVATWAPKARVTLGNMEEDVRVSRVMRPLMLPGLQ